MTIDSIDGAELDDWLSEPCYLGSGGGVLLSNVDMSMGVPVVRLRPDRGTIDDVSAAVGRR